MHNGVKFIPVLLHEHLVLMHYPWQRHFTRAMTVCGAGSLVHWTGAKQPSISRQPLRESGGNCFIGISVSLIYFVTLAI